MLLSGADLMGITRIEMHCTEVALFNMQPAKHGSSASKFWCGFVIWVNWFTGKRERDLGLCGVPSPSLSGSPPAMRESGNLEIIDKLRPINDTETLILNANLNGKYLYVYIMYICLYISLAPKGLSAKATAGHFILECPMSTAVPLPCDGDKTERCDYQRALVRVTSLAPRPPHT